MNAQGKLFAIRAARTADGADGRIERLAGSFAASQLQRVPWYDRDRFVFVTLGVCALIGKFTLVALACMYFSWCAFHRHLITPAHRF